tara:strand:+ start:83 stop:541 length:459 start_codon:yes stop_codon:yes gene_type:complete
MCDDTKEYKASPLYKKSTFSEELWTNIICDKLVVLSITYVWRYGEFGLFLNEEEKKEVLEKDTVIMNDYQSEFYQTTDCCEKIVEIKEIDKYSQEEKDEIYKSIYENVEEEELFEESILEEENGWSLDDTIYEISGGIVLEEGEMEEVSLDN